VGIIGLQSILKKKLCRYIKLQILVRAKWQTALQAKQGNNNAVVELSGYEVDFQQGISWSGTGEVCDTTPKRTYCNT
jgi:hypothetical protein